MTTTFFIHSKSKPWCTKFCVRVSSDVFLPLKKKKLNKFAWKTNNFFLRLWSKKYFCEQVCFQLNIILYPAYQVETKLDLFNSTLFFYGRKTSELTLLSATINVFWRSSKWVLSSSCVILPALFLKLSRKKLSFICKIKLNLTKNKNKMQNFYF